MTIEEMQYNVDIRTREIAIISFRPFYSTEIETMLNKAQADLVDELYDKYAGRTVDKFEYTEKLRRELNELITFTDITAFDSATPGRHTNGYFVSLPENFLYSIEESCNISYTDCNDTTQTKIVKVKPITYDEYLANKSNPFSKPTEDLIWRMDYNSSGVASSSKRHELITDGVVTLSNYYLRYLKRATDMSIADGTDCILDESLHEEIVDRASALLLATLPKPTETTNT